MELHKFYLGFSGYDQEIADENDITLEKLESLDQADILVGEEEHPGYFNIYFMKYFDDKGQILMLSAISSYHIKDHQRK